MKIMMLNHQIYELVVNILYAECLLVSILLFNQGFC
jgi:hypothetical protein